MAYNNGTLGGAILQKAYNAGYKLGEVVDKVKESKPPAGLVKAINTIKSPMNAVADVVDSTRPLSQQSKEFINEVNTKKNGSTVTAGGFRTPNVPKVETPVVTTNTQAPAPAPVVTTTTQAPVKPTVTASGLRTTNVPKQAPVVTETVEQPETVATTSGTPPKDKMTEAETRARNAVLREKNVTGQKNFSDKKTTSSTTQAPTTQLGDAGMLKLDDDQTAAMKMNEVTGLKQSDIASNEADRDRTLQAGEQALEGFRNIVGVDKDGNVDMNRKGSIGATLQRDFDDYKSQQTELSKGYESTRKSRVSSQMRANLLARGVDISNIPQEQLIALSDEVGAKAFEDIYNNKQNTLNAITAKQDAVTNKLNELKQQGLIAEDKYNTLKATVASQFEKTRNDIQRNYVNDIFGITDTAKTKKEGKQTAAFNALESMLKAVPSTDAPALRERFMNIVENGTEAIKVIKAISADAQFKALAKKLAETTLASEKDKLQLSTNYTNAKIKNLEADTEAKPLETKAKLIAASKTGKPKVPYADQPLTLTETATLRKEFSDLNIDLTGMTKGQAMNLINKGPVPAGK